MKSLVKYIIIVFFTVVLLSSNSLFAQEDSSAYPLFGGIVFMDSLVVTASRAGFNKNDFIEMVKRDSSFYTAFKNIRTMEYESDNDIRFFDKKHKQIARLSNRIRQNMEGNCRTMEIINQEVEGNYYKRKQKKRYYTAKMYEEIFFTYERTCHGTGPAIPSSALEKRVEALKVLIFKPGTVVDVPVVGKKTQIFSKALLPYYDYAIESKKYKSGIDCYVFTTKLKDDLTQRTRKKTIIKELETYFDKKTFAVIARNYTLYYRSTLVDFNAKINIELTKVGDAYVPEFLHFEGKWDIPFKSEERVWFETKFFY